MWKVKVNNVFVASLPPPITSPQGYQESGENKIVKIDPIMQRGMLCRKQDIGMEDGTGRNNSFSRQFQEKERRSQSRSRSLRISMQVQYRL